MDRQAAQALTAFNLFIILVSVSPRLCSLCGTFIIVQALISLFCHVKFEIAPLVVEEMKGECAKSFQWHFYHVGVAVTRNMQYSSVHIDVFHMPRNVYLFLPFIPTPPAHPPSRGAPVLFLYLCRRQ